MIKNYRIIEMMIVVLTVGDTIPKFKIKAIQNAEIIDVSSDKLKGCWTILFFYPEDFSFICPTEVVGYNSAMKELDIKETKIIGVSVDSLETHKKWIAELGISYPLVSDEQFELSKLFGVLDPNDNKSHRATFIINPEQIIDFVMVTSRNVGRSVKETIRILQSLQTGEVCPADYNPRTQQEE